MLPEASRALTVTRAAAWPSPGAGRVTMKRPVAGSYTPPVVMLIRSAGRMPSTASVTVPVTVQSSWFSSAVMTGASLSTMPSKVATSWSR